MERKPYSAERWWDNPKPIVSQCGLCKNYIGYTNGKVMCKAFDDIPRDILGNYILHTQPIDGDHGYRYEPKDPESPKPQKREKIMDYD